MSRSSQQNLPVKELQRRNPAKALRRTRMWKKIAEVGARFTRTEITSTNFISVSEIIMILHQYYNVNCLFLNNMGDIII